MSAKIKKVLLIYPPAGDNSIVHNERWLLEPLALEYIAAALPGREVKILDMRIDRGFEKELLDFQPDTIGFTGYTIHVNQILKMARKAKIAVPDIKIIVGGHHATIRPADFDIPEVDYIVMGEGCRVISDMIDPSKVVAEIPGLAYFRGGERVYNPPDGAFNLDDLPFPKRELIADYSASYCYDYIQCSMIRTTVGCPFRCSFCSLWGIYQGKYLTRTPEKVLEELKTIKTEFVFFADDESMIDYKRMTELANLIERASLKKKFCLYARADTIVHTPELFEQWQKVGLDRICIGLESFSDEGLRMLGKKTNIDIQGKAIEILRELGISIEALFIVAPEYRRGDFKSLREYVRKYRLWDSTFSVLTPLPGSQIWEDKKDQLITKNWDYWDGIHAVFKPFLPEGMFYLQYAWLGLTFIPFWERVAILRQSSLKVILQRIIAGVRLIFDMFGKDKKALK